MLEIAKEVSSIVDRHEVQRHGRCSATDDFTFQVGANAGETISTARDRPRRGIGAAGARRSLRAHGPVGRPPARRAALSSARPLATHRRAIDKPIENVSKVRGNYGAVQNRLEHRLANLATYQENLTASESRIRDVDMAAEMTKFTKLNILQQAGTSMLAQANQAPQSVLSLLR